MTTAPGFAKDIRPFFTQTDVDHMKRFGMDLSSYDDVVKHKDNILAAVTAGTMPPAASGGVRWTQAMCDAFSDWMKQGCAP